jgi:hypothetical protein
MSNTGHSGDIATGAIETGDEAQSYRVVAERKHNRSDTTASTLRRLGGILAHGADNCHALVDEFGRQRRQPVVLSVCKTVFERDVLPFDKTGFFQAVPERG